MCDSMTVVVALKQDDFDGLNLFDRAQLVIELHKLKKEKVFWRFVGLFRKYPTWPYRRFAEELKVTPCTIISWVRWLGIKRRPLYKCTKERLERIRKLEMYIKNNGPAFREEVAKEFGWSVPLVLRYVTLSPVLRSVRFSIGYRSALRYGSYEIFGPLARRVLIYRVDEIERALEFVCRRIPVRNSISFRKSQRHHLGVLFPYPSLVDKYHGRLYERFKATNSLNINDGGGIGRVL